jgi:hypothetical protein
MDLCICREAEADVRSAKVSLRNLPSGRPPCRLLVWGYPRGQFCARRRKPARRAVASFAGYTPAPKRRIAAVQTNASGRAEQAGDSASLEIVARAGLIAYGGVHLLIGWLAVQIAWGASDSKSADTSGALKTLASQPFGKVLLWLVAVGLVALALWQASEAVWAIATVKAPSGSESRSPAGQWP